jgi:hypothetical protein
MADCAAARASAAEVDCFDLKNENIGWLRFIYRENGMYY